MYVRPLSQHHGQRRGVACWRLAGVAGAEIRRGDSVGWQRVREFFHRAGVAENNFIRLIDRVRRAEQRQ